MMFTCSCCNNEPRTEGKVFIEAKNLHNIRKERKKKWEIKTEIACSPGTQEQGDRFKEHALERF